MRETLLALYKLQEIDSRVLEIEKGAAIFPARIRELEGQLNQLRTELGTIRTELEQKKTEQATDEGLIREENAKLQKWKRRLNDIKTPREYQALSREVETTERQVREAEERVVLVMADIEQRQLKVNEKEQELRARESEVNAQVKELREREQILNREAQAAKAGRSEITAKVPPRVLTLYDRVRNSRGGVAVALVKGGSCSACNVAIRPQLVVEIRRLDAVHQCPSCSRILVLDALVAGPSASPSG